MKVYRRLTGVLLLSCSAIASGAYAQDNPTPSDAASVGDAADQNAAENAGKEPAAPEGIEDIVVTAERRVSTAQRTAASIAVRTGDELQRQARTTLNQVLEDVSGISGTVFSARVGAATSSPELNIAIRGVRSNSTGGGLAQPATTAIYVDGVFGGVSGSYDVDRVEVLRGPQGTLYGRSSTGGVVSIHTRNPDLDDFSVSGLAEAGSYDLRHLTGVLNAPIVSDKIALRVAADHYERDGYYTREGAALNTDSVRAKLLFKASDDLTVLLGYNFQKDTPSNGGLTINLTPTVGEYIYDRTSTPVGKGSNQFATYSAEINWKLGGVQLTYLGAIRDFKQRSTGYTVGPGGGILGTAVVDPNNRTDSQELRASFGDEGSFVAQVGGIYFRNKATDFTNETFWVTSNALLTGRAQRRTQELIGGYGEATLWLAENTRLTGGARYDHTAIDTTFTYRSNNNRLCNTPSAPPTCLRTTSNGPNSGLPEDIRSFTVTPATGGSATFKSFNYKARIEQDLAPGNMVYAMISTGAIPGDIQVSSSIPAFAYKYSSERLTSYEIGSKNRFLDNHLQANLTLFHYDYGGFQTVVTPNPANTTEQYFVSVPAKFSGGELEIVARPTDRDVVTANFNYVRARYSNPESIVIQRPAPFGSLPFTDIVYNTTIANVIDKQANASYEHRFDFVAGSSLTARASVRYQSSYQARSLSRAEFNAGVAKYLRIPEAGIVNLSLDWNSADSRFGVTAYVRNVTDRRIPTDVLVQAITPTGITGSLTEQFIEPRTFGLIGRFRL